MLARGPQHGADSGGKARACVRVAPCPSPPDPPVHLHPHTALHRPRVGRLARPARPGPGEVWCAEANGGCLNQRRASTIAAAAAVVVVVVVAVTMAAAAGVRGGVRGGGRGGVGGGGRGGVEGGVEGGGRGGVEGGVERGGRGGVEGGRRQAAGGRRQEAGSRQQMARWPRAFCTAYHTLEPDTGASRKRPPRSRTATSSAFMCSAVSVAQSTMAWPFGAASNPARMPSGAW